MRARGIGGDTMRSMTGRTSAAVIVLALVVAGAGVMLLLPGDRQDPAVPADTSTARAGDPAPARVVGCRERVEGGRLAPSAGRDAILGPIALLSAASNYRAMVSSPESARPDPNTGLNPMKVLALVRAGTTVRLSVPRAQRAWMRLLYGDHRRGEHTVTLRACRRSASKTQQRRECGWPPHTACRWRNTQFAGGLSIMFAQAPRRGRCAELIASTEGRRLRARLFRPRPGLCAAPAELESHRPVRRLRDRRVVRLGVKPRLPLGSRSYHDRTHELRVELFAFS